MFSGFNKVGGFRTTVAKTNLFEGFPSISAMGSNGLLGGIPTANLVAWFRPDTNITLATGVSQWQDTTGAYTLAQATGANQPSYVQGDATYNGRPYLKFNGSQRMSAANTLYIGANQTWQVIVICSMPTGSGVNMIESGSIGGSVKGSYAVSWENGTSWFGIYINDAGSQISTSPSPSAWDANLHMHSWELDRAVSGKTYSSIDSNWRTGTGNALTSLTTYAAQTLKLGQYESANVPNGSICFDVLFYSNSLSQSDYLMLRNYMGQLYNF